jgi:hypothetical protein
VLRETVLEAETLLEQERLVVDKGKTLVQDGGQWSGQKQILFITQDKGAWLEVAYDIPEDGRYSLNAGLTKSFDYGMYQVYLDGKEFGGARNFYSDTIVIEPVRLGVHQLTKGEHKIRFQCVGIDPRANHAHAHKGMYFGIDSIQFRLLP